jgi:hypothetical protein
MPIYENDGNLDEDAARVACYALSIVNYDPSIDDATFNAAWEKAKADGILDPNDVMLSPQGFVDILGYPLKFRDGHFPANTKLDPPNQHIIGKWVSGSKTHFVVMDGKGTDKDNVIYDPIRGGSLTVAEGHFDSYRIFDKVV